MSVLGPISEIDWGEMYYRNRSRSQHAGNNEPDPEGELLPVDLLVRRYQRPYPDKQRREWMAKRVRQWWESRG